MPIYRKAVLWSVLAALAFFLGCSADAVTPPEPTVTTPGSFFAVQEADGNYRLYRTLGVLSADDQEVLLMVILYRPISSTLAGATELAKDVHLAVEQPLEAFAGDPDDLHVVWFRTLNSLEREAIE